MPPTLMFFWEISEFFTGAEAGECSVKTMLLKISQYSQKNAYVGAIF